MPVPRNSPSICHPPQETGQKGKKEEALFSHSSTQNYKCLNIPTAFTGSIFKRAFLIEPWNNFSLYIAFMSLGPTCPRPI